RVIGTTRADEGLAALATEPVEVVMTDQRMPGMSGIELLHRARDARPDVVRLLFTGYSDIHAVIDAINKGNVYRYISKPWHPDELMAVIRDAVSLHDLVSERNRLLRVLQQKNEELSAANAELMQLSDLKSAFI